MAGIKVLATVKAVSTRTRGLRIEYELRREGRQDQWHEVSQKIAGRILPTLNQGDQVVVILGPQTDRNGKPIITFISKDTSSFIPDEQYQAMRQQNPSEQTYTSDELNPMLGEEPEEKTQIEPNDDFYIIPAVKSAAEVVPIPKVDGKIDIEQYKKDLKMVAKTIVEVMEELVNGEEEPEVVVTYEDFEGGDNAKDQQMDEDASNELPQEEPAPMDTNQ